MPLKYDKLRIRWSKREQDIQYIYPRRCDGSYLHYALSHLAKYDGKNFFEELEARGYDLKTIEFSIEQRKGVESNGT